MPVVDRVEAPKIPADLETLRCALQVCEHYITLHYNYITYSNDADDD